LGGEPLRLTVHWVRAETVVEMAYLTWTGDNLLQQVVVSRSTRGQAGAAGDATYAASRIDPLCRQLKLHLGVNSALPALGSSISSR
jgi:hypothetical protein